MARSPFELITGSNNLLIVAPHGHKYDVGGLARLTRLIAHKLDCYAVINDKYRLPWKDLHGQEIVLSTKDKIADLNNLAHIDQTLEKSFLKPIVDFKNEIIKNHKSCVFITLGAQEIIKYQDYNLEADKQIANGVEKQDVYESLENPAKSKSSIYIKNGFLEEQTVNKTVVDALVKKFMANGLSTEIAEEVNGHEKTFLYQLFKTKSHQDRKVQSLSIELNCGGFIKHQRNQLLKVELSKALKTGLVNTLASISKVTTPKGIEAISSPFFIQPKERIKRATNLLLIAPHAHPDNYAYTGKLVRYIAEKIDCYAIVNNEYRVPKEKEPPSKTQKNLNCYNPHQVEDHLAIEILEPIDEVLCLPGNTLIVWFVDDCDFIKAVDKDMLLDSTCQKNPWITQKLLSLLESNHINAIDSPMSANFTCSLFKNQGTLNNVRLFSDEDDHTTCQVVSLQLSVLKEGFFDDDNFIKTCDILSNVLSEISPPLVPENTPDDDVVEKAYLRVRDIFQKHFQNAVYEAGQYIIEEFYNDNLDCVRSHTPLKNQSLNKLIERFQSTDPDSPSRTWISNAVNLVLDKVDIERELEETTVQTYEQLNLSHKIRLIPIKDFAKKEQLIMDTAKHGYSVRKLREVIMGTKEEKPKSLPNLIASPNMLFSGDYAYALEEGSIAELSLDAIKKSKNQTANKIQEIEDRIKKMNVKIEEQKGHVTNYQQLSQALEKAERDKLSNPVAN